jgi:SAM-dependent methyltransferase
MCEEKVLRHLDLGCGDNPRNPLKADELFGLDLRGRQVIDETHLCPGVWSWNVLEGPLPFPDNYFSSCSAYDFLEHVPRVWPAANAKGVTFPFVNLMSEIFRVLAPGGVFLAATPAFPKPNVFVDPTHVNFLTIESHRYFCGSAPLAEMYGFRGSFHADMVEFGIPRFLDAPTPNSWVRRAKMFARAVRGNSPQHMLWRLKAAK